MRSGDSLHTVQRYSQYPEAVIDGNSVINNQDIGFSNATIIFAPALHP